MYLTNREQFAFSIFDTQYTIVTLRMLLAAKNFEMAVIGLPLK